MNHAALRLRLRLGMALFSIGVGFTPATHAQSLPDGFVLETVVSGPFGGLPVGFTFLPDGRVLIIEKETGGVRVAALGSGTSVLCATIPGVLTNSERGLLGIAVDPAWPARPYIYLMATYIDGWTRVTMHTVTGDLTQEASTNLVFNSTYVLLQILDATPNHNGGTLRFGPDGLLYVSVGDDGDVCAVQRVDEYNGKILRLDVATMPLAGSGPPPLSNITPAANPYFGATGRARLVYAMGMRNPFRFTIDPLTENLYIGDVGAHAWEEMNEIVAAGHAGVNLGWPFYEGRLFIPANCSGAAPFVGPIYAYAHQGAPLAVIAGPVYRRVPGSPVSFPASYEGSLFLHDHYSGWIRRLQSSQGGWRRSAAAPGQTDPENWATGMGYISDMQMGSDGALYIMVLLGVEGVEQGLNRIVNNYPVDASVATGRMRSVVLPNPGRAEHGVTVRLLDPTQRVSRLLVYSTNGRLVRALEPGTASSNLFWDGRDQDGHPVAPGLYFYDLGTRAGTTASGKFLVIR